ncbi:MAG TPA: hypothetical protein PLP19_10920 [bacterium]|nr:hypothetical protein [bacterium]HPN43992.1 hypothetical protein [bacterium]
MKLNTCYLFAIAVIALLITALSCEKDLSVTGEHYQTIDKASVALTLETSFSRQIIYEKEAILRANADTNDFKAVYTLQEIRQILADTNYARQEHSGLFIDDDCYYQNIYETIQGCDDLVLGYVLKVECRQEIPGDNSTVYTFVNVQNLQSYKNKITSEIILIKDFGGKIGDSVTDMIHFPRPQYTEKELALVALKKQGNEFITFGRNQGKFNVHATINQDLPVTDAGRDLEHK